MWRGSKIRYWLSNNNGIFMCGNVTAREEQCEMCGCVVWSGAFMLTSPDSSKRRKSLIRRHSVTSRKMWPLRNTLWRPEILYGTSSWSTEGIDPSYFTYPIWLSYTCWQWHVKLLYVERNFVRIPLCLATSHCGCACQSCVLQRCHVWWNEEDWRPFSLPDNLHSAAAKSGVVADLFDVCVCV
jgi:hypothetical protein